MHILLIEPDTVLATTYMQALKRAGHTVAVAHDAQMAIDCADEQVPHVVILELQLVEHNGLEFLYEFRSYPEWGKIPVIIHSWVSIHTQKVEQLRQTLGVTAYYYKPQTTLKLLLAGVHEHLVMAS